MWRRAFKEHTESRVRTFSETTSVMVGFKKAKEIEATGESKKE